MVQRSCSCSRPFCGATVWGFCRCDREVFERVQCDELEEHVKVVAVCANCRAALRARAELEECGEVQVALTFAGWWALIEGAELAEEHDDYAEAMAMLAAETRRAAAALGRSGLCCGKQHADSAGSWSCLRPVNHIGRCAMFRERA